MLFQTLDSGLRYHDVPCAPLRVFHLSPTRLLAIVGIVLLVAAIVWVQHRQGTNGISISSGRGDAAETSR